jgi:hypothetical protein
MIYQYYHQNTPKRFVICLSVLYINKHSIQNEYIKMNIHFLIQIFMNLHLLIFIYQKQYLVILINHYIEIYKTKCWLNIKIWVVYGV